MSVSLAQQLQAAIPSLSVLPDEPMARHCSFHIGGPAEVLATVEHLPQLQTLLSFLHDKQIPMTVIGQGSNLLVADTGIPGVVVRLAGDFDAIQITPETCEITAGAGVRLRTLALAAKDASLAGLAFAHGIPGSLGGAIVMNAGAYGGEMRDVITEVTCMNGAGALVTYTASELDFSYRHSRFSEHPSLILSAKLQLSPGVREEIARQQNELLQKRRESQPLDLPSAGSTFKRPQGGFAAALIDQAGLRGYRVGDAQVSEKHAGFVVNLGSATCADVTALIQHIQAKVYDRFQIQLEPEVRMLPATPKDLENLA